MADRDSQAPKATRRGMLIGSTALAVSGLAATADAQAPASPPATDGSALPLPAPPFGGTIGATYKDSRSDFPQPVVPPAGAPNVLFVLIDDLGFAGTTPFGGLIPTPNIDAFAGNGLIYNAMHNTALCSPSRAALLSGRNHHQVGMGSLTEGSTGFPGYNSIWGQENAAIAEVLRYHGYSTAIFGKWHDTPDWETSAAGPFYRWPTGKGFDYFYGFHGGETSQYYPQLYLNTRPVEPSKTPEQGYTLNEDLADKAIGWLREQQSVAPDKPWFAYYAPGAMHAPHQVHASYITPFRGKFDMGWDRFREEAFANQRRLGVVPESARLTVRPAELPAWDSLSDDQRRLYARQMEVFAGFMVQTDEQIGRVLEAVRQGPNANNTLIMLALGDNGASAEGGLTGTLNNMATQNGFPDDVATMLRSIDEIGGPKHENHFAVGWAWALDAPFQWTKQVASHFGGTRCKSAMCWATQNIEIGDALKITTFLIAGAMTFGSASGALAQAGGNAVPVTADNFPRAESDLYFSNIVHDGGLGKFVHRREPAAVNNQTIIRLNRDTLYSAAVFDLDAGPVTITLPDAGKRFMSTQVIDEDQYTPEVDYGAGSHVLSKDKIGTRYVLIGVWTLVNPADPNDMQAVHALQDAMKIEQPGGPGKFEAPHWDQASQRCAARAGIDVARHQAHVWSEGRR